MCSRSHRHRHSDLPGATVSAMTHFHDLEMTSITGEQVSFNQYKGNLALIVNVASA